MAGFSNTAATCSIPTITNSPSWRNAGNKKGRFTAANHVETDIFYFNAPLSGRREDLLNDGFQCFADIRQAANGLHACGFQRCEFLISRTFTTGDNRACVTHTLTFRRGHTRDVTDYWLGYVFFDVSSRFFFRATTDLTDHDDRFGLWIFLEQ